MVTVKLSTCAPGWPWYRQIPEHGQIWGGVKFVVDSDVSECDAWVVFESLEQPQTSSCPESRTIFVAGEPDSIGSYSPNFLNQFAYVVSGRNDISHHRQIRMQQGHPWFVEKSYDELLGLSPVVKSKDVCVISSSKNFTDGHRDRLRFLDYLKNCGHQGIDVWGRGIRDFENKWEVLSRYRYAIVLENFSGNDFLTEKLPDALLSYCFPLYYGCTNVGRYLPSDSWLDIDITRPQTVINMVQNLLDDPNDYERRLPSIIRARRYYLDHVQFFANLITIVQMVVARTGDERSSVTLHPQALMSQQRPAQEVVIDDADELKKSSSRRSVSWLSRWWKRP